MTFLQLTHIQKAFANHPRPAVADFNLSVARGEFISFLGPSGCGKTTTLRMIAGFEQPTSGQILLNGADITHQPANRRNVGMVFQSYALFPNMTVAENIAFGLKIRQRPAEAIRKRVSELLALIKLPDKSSSYPYQLSGGQQQRVALVRALAIEPQVLLLDEPLSALDAKIRDELRVEIRRIQQQLGITTIYVTHDQEEALSLSDRIVVMNMGVMEQVGTPGEIYNAPRTLFVASFVGALNQLACTVQDAAAKRLAYGQFSFTTTAPMTQSNGSAVTVMLRPEELRLEPRPGDNAFMGVVEAVSFLGATVRLTLKTADTTVLLEVFNERELRLPAVGETQTVYFPPQACWVMPQS